MTVVTYTNKTLENHHFMHLITSAIRYDFVHSESLGIQTNHHARALSEVVKIQIARILSRETQKTGV